MRRRRCVWCKQHQFSRYSQYKCVKTASNYYKIVIIRRVFYCLNKLWKTIVVHNCPQMSEDVLWITVDK